MEAVETVEAVEQVEAVTAVKAVEEVKVVDAVYSLGKLPSKYLILKVLGFALFRDEAGMLLIDASH